MGKIENINIEAAPSLARTATFVTKDLKNIRNTGGHVIIDVTDVTATGQIIPIVEAKDAVSGEYYTLLTGAAITTVSTVVLKIHPSLTAVANEVANDVFPVDYRITFTHLNSVSITYSVGVSLV